jgi:hypothetical protein
MSNGTFFSFVRHWTHGSFANVVIPAKTASAVTNYEQSSNILYACARAREESID